MVSYVKGNSKHVEMVKAESEVCTKTQGVNGGLQRHNRTRTRSTTFKCKNIASDRTKDNIFLKPKDDRTYGERVDDRLRSQGSADSERRSQDGGSTVQLYDINKESKKCKSRRKEAKEEPAKLHGEEYRRSTRSISTPHLHCDFVPLTMGNLSKDVI